MFIRKQKIKRKSGIKTYYYIVKSVSGKKHPLLKVVKYIGTAENIIKVFNSYKKNKPKK